MVPHLTTSTDRVTSAMARSYSENDLPKAHSPKPRILIIGPTPPPYHGVAVAIDSLLQSRFTDTFDVTHLELADRRGISHVNKPDWHDALLFLRQWLRLSWLLPTRRPHLVYLPLSQSTVGFIRDSLFIWLAVLAGAKVVTHLHAGALRAWYDVCWAPMRAYVRMVLRSIHKMIVLGESLREIFSGLLPEERVAVVPNGVDLYWGEPARESGARTRPYRILHMSTLNRMKGTLVLLAAIPTVLRHRRDVEFVFAGSWSHQLHRETAEWYVRRHNLEPYVRFIGEVTGLEKQACFKEADVFVFPGVQQEGQPLVVLEAMAAGLPILYTNQGCLRETVINGECGIEIHTEDQYDLANRLCFLLDHPDDLRHYGDNARRRCHLLFSREHHVERMIRTIRDALAEISPTSSSPPVGAPQPR